MHSLDSSQPFAPLPGTVPSPRGLFIDRWGTLLDVPERGFCAEPDEVRFHEGALDALFRAHRAGWNVYLIGNEDAVAFGEVGDESWTSIEARFLGELEGHGVQVKRNYACLDHPDGVGQHRYDSVFLLPNTGSLYHAAHNDRVELSKSWVIGDSTLELVSGWRAGCRLAGVRTGRALGDGTFHVDPEFLAADLAEAVLCVLGAQPAELG